MNVPTPRLTRRTLLVGTSRIALLAMVSGSAACIPREKGDRWADGTFFSDETGWIDGDSEGRGS